MKWNRKAGEDYKEGQVEALNNRILPLLEGKEQVFQGLRKIFANKYGSSEKTSEEFRFMFSVIEQTLDEVLHDQIREFAEVEEFETDHFDMDEWTKNHTFSFLMKQDKTPLGEIMRTELK